MSADVTSPTAYEFLGVHPSAPYELVSAVYWMGVSDLQRRRTAGEPVDSALHILTRSYELVGDPVKRDEYNIFIGFSDTPVVSRAMPKMRSSLFRRLFRGRLAIAQLDCYEMIGLDPRAPADRLSVAYRIMKDHYLRVPGVRQRSRLLLALDEAYAVLSDDDDSRRARYDEPNAKRTDGNRPEPVPSRAISRSPPAKSDVTALPPDIREIEAESRRRQAGESSTERAPNGQTASAGPIAAGWAKTAIVRTGSLARWTVGGGVHSVVRIGSRILSVMAPGRDARADAPVASPRRAPRRPAPGDVEAKFLGRLASRVEEEPAPNDVDLGDQQSTNVH